MLKLLMAVLSFQFVITANAKPNLLECSMGPAPRESVRLVFNSYWFSESVIKVSGKSFDLNIPQKSAPKTIKGSALKWLINFDISQSSAFQKVKDESEFAMYRKYYDSMIAGIQDSYDLHIEKALLDKKQIPVSYTHLRAHET